MRTLGNLNAMLQEAASALDRVFARDRRAPRDRRKAGCAGARRHLAAKSHSGTCHFAMARTPERSQGIDITGPAARMTALVGRSGSGKSASVARSAALRSQRRRGPDRRSGRARRRASQPARADRDRQPGVDLFDDTVRANIALRPPDATQAEIEAAARSAAAHDFISGLPEGYDTRLGDGDRACQAASASASRLPAHRQGRPDPAARRGDERAGLQNPSGLCRTRWHA